MGAPHCVQKAPSALSLAPHCVQKADRVTGTLAASRAGPKSENARPTAPPRLASRPGTATNKMMPATIR